MEGNDMKAKEQFLTEVFPEELKEIKKRQENLTIVPNEHINKAIKAYENFSNAHREYDNAIKKKHSILHPIKKAAETIANIGPFKIILSKVDFFKTERCSEEEDPKRLEVKKNDARKLLEKEGSPSTNLALVGLALSGGGIRSATFNLGVLQVLAERGILKHVDYMSTVSGGGYIGSCLSSTLTGSYDFSVSEFVLPLTIEKLCKVINDDKYNVTLKSRINTIDWLNELLKVPNLYDTLVEIKPNISFSKNITDLVGKTKEYRKKRFPDLTNDEQDDTKKLNRLLLEETYPHETPKNLNSQTGPEKDKFPFRHRKGVPEPKALKHLRNYGNYIAPNGIIDWMKIPALFLRGALINLLLLLPYVVGAVLLTVYFYGDTLRSIKKESRYIITESAREKLKAQGLPNNVLEQLEGKIFAKKEDVSIKGEYAAWFKPFILKQINKRNFSWDLKTFYYFTCIFGILYLIHVILFIGFQVPFNRNIKSRTLYDKTFGIGLLVVLICVLIESMVTALSYYLILDLNEIKTIITAVASLIPIIFAGKAAANVSQWRGKLTIYFLGMLGPFILFLIYLLLCEWALNSSIPFLYWIFATILILIFTRALTDINKTSFHNFYRDQLSKAYLFQTDRKGSNVKPEDKQKLSKLNGEIPKAPYHLINVALNLHGSDDLNLHGRNADFFILSKHFCGSMQTGFCETHEMETVDSHLNLGTAMAISGAAAAPNMGTATIKPLVFIMTLLNIRLGYWLPNPQKLTERRYRFLGFPYFENYQYQIKYEKYSPFSGVEPIYLLRELFGWISEKSEYINVSDGGHIENLGIFELLRRRCKYIIACDAEADSTMTFGGLAKLIRYARTDLSIDIEIDLDDVRKGENGFSHNHCAFGKIDYGNGEIGYLLYIKSSMTGDENEYIREYRSKNEAFPHESTADQFFDEAQFEAYRALGYHITDKLEGWEILEPERERSKIDDWCWANAVKWEMGCEIENQRERRLDEWFKIQESSLLPRYGKEEKFVDLQMQLSKIEKMYQDTAIAEYAYQVYPELFRDKKKLYNAGEREISPGSECGQDEEKLRKIFHFCNQQMQLMENVFVALQLDKPYNRDHRLNRGWMNLFRRWAEAPFFRWSWAVSIGTYSLGFQMFCEDVLKLHRIVQCRRGDEGKLIQQEKDYLIQREDTVNFFNEDGKLLPKYQLWIAEMSVCINDIQWQSESFPFGFIIIEPELKMAKNTYQINLLYYQIRNIYRQMRLLEKMVQNLMDTMKKEDRRQTEFCVIFETEKDKLRYGYFFERHGYKLASKTSNL